MVFGIILLILIVFDLITNILISERYMEQNRLLKAQNESLSLMLKESAGFAQAVKMIYEKERSKENDKAGSN